MRQVLQRLYGMLGIILWESKRKTVAKFSCLRRVLFLLEIEHPSLTSPNLAGKLEFWPELFPLSGHRLIQYHEACLGTLR
jgi:hypothetical protein